MRILYYDPFSGISGDMNLGALINLGVPKEYLIEELKKLKISGYDIKIVEDSRKGITGTKVTVSLDNRHDDEHDHSINEEEHHHHRNFKDIIAIINGSELNDNVKKKSLDIFTQVAEAEGKIHGRPSMEVHFHEVGAVDSIVDIVGAAICLDYLKIDKVLSGPVELGGGFVKCAHGLFPVPAPATAEILKGIPVKLGAVDKETTTPTGAAILASTVAEFTDKKQFIVQRVAYGIGQRDTEIPNVLRVYLGEMKTEQAGLDQEEASILECNIDDMNPELYDYVMEKLFHLGAMDVFMTPIIMKKSRPGIKLSVLCNEENEIEMTELILKETTTLGVRKYKVYKTMLKRECSNMDTVFGKVNVKTSFWAGKELKTKAEYEDCKRLAKQHNVPISYIYDEINRKRLEK